MPWFSRSSCLCLGGCLLGFGGGGACGEEIAFSAQTRTDTFQQAPTDQVDILFVVDDSASMTAQQELLADGFEDFTRGLGATVTDFHIGVIKIDFEYDDASRGVLLGQPRVITPADDYRRLFVERALVGTGGSGREKGLEAASFAVSPQSTAASGPNEGFLRDEANLLVVIVSDEDDCSDGGEFGYNFDLLDCYRRIDELVPPEAWVRRMRAVKRRPEQLTVSAIVGPEDATGLCGQVTVPGTRYMRAAELTGGAVFDICEPDWSDFLEQLGVEAVSPERSFPLSCGARPDSLEVEVDGEVIPGSAYAYDPEGLALVFEEDAVPGRGAEIKASYEIEPGTCAIG